MASVIPPSLAGPLTLALVPDLGPKRTRTLLEHFGHVDRVLQATGQELEAVPGIGPKLAQRYLQAFRKVDVEKEWQQILEKKVNVTLFTDSDYPAPLASIENAPTLLYSRGHYHLSDVNAVAVVGSRSCTTYGKKMADRICTGLARAGWTIISGLARGIDGVAHTATLQAGGRTIAVLAGGLGRIYPPEHSILAEEVVAHGMIVTETPMSVEPQPGMFPARNRIISGLSRGVVIIEADMRSGALITATHAAEQGREVFAVPGSVESLMSSGCLDLIRKGARLVRSADDIIEDLQGLYVPVARSSAPERPDQPMSSSQTTPVEPRESSHATKPAVPRIPTPLSHPPQGLTELQQAIWQLLESPKHFDEMSRILQVAAETLTPQLMIMEMRAVVRRQPGNHFERL